MSNLARCLRFNGRCEEGTAIYSGLMREAQINLLRLFKHLNPNGGKLMPDLRRQVESKIREEGWTTEGMRVIEIPTGA